MRTKFKLLLLCSLNISAGVMIGYFFTIHLANSAEKELLTVSVDERATVLLEDLESSMLMIDALNNVDYFGLQSLLISELTKNMVYAKLNTSMKKSQFWPSVSAALNRAKTIKQDLIKRQEECDKKLSDSIADDAVICEPTLKALPNTTE